MENVKALLCSKFRGEFEKWLRVIGKMGYTSSWRVMNAKDYGMPQNRERVFVVSILGEEFDFPKGFPLNRNILPLLESDVDEKFFKRQDKTVSYDKKGVIGISINTTRKLEFKGKASMDFCPCLRASDYKNAHLLWSVSRKNKVYARKLTPREYGRFMDVTDRDIDKFISAGISNTQMYKMFGNSIVVSCLYHIFKKIGLGK